MLSELRSTSLQSLYFVQPQSSGTDMNSQKDQSDVRGRIDQNLGIKRAVKNVLRGQDSDSEYEPINKDRSYKQAKKTEQKQIRTRDAAKRQKANRERKKQMDKELEEGSEWLEDQYEKLSSQILDLKENESFYKDIFSKLQAQNNFLQEQIRHLQEENTTLRNTLETKLSQEALLVITNRL